MPESEFEFDGLQPEGHVASNRAGAAQLAAGLPKAFGFKDVFTCVNIIGGVAAIIFCIEGNLRYAGYAFLLGYVLGDTLDGLVARKTNTSNRFGAQFDQVGDHFTQAIVPAFMLYVAYRPTSAYLGAVLAAILVISGSIRHARGAVCSPRTAIAYVGMPRTVAALLIISYLNSTLVPLIPGWRWIGIALVLVASVAQLLPIPFRTHKGRRWRPWVKYFVISFFSMTLVSLVVFPSHVFDVTLFWLVLYSGTSWLELSRDELRAFFEDAKAWAVAVRSAR